MGARLRSIAYSAGNLGVSLFFNTTQTWLIFFYVDVVRLDARLVGLAFALAYGVWNAVNDPLVGALSDRTRSRWGRRVPYIALGTPALLVLFFLVWSPPLGGRPLADPRSWALLAWFTAVDRPVRPRQHRSQRAVCLAVPRAVPAAPRADRGFHVPAVRRDRRDRARPRSDAAAEERDRRPGRRAGGVEVRGAGAGRGGRRLVGRVPARQPRTRARRAETGDAAPAGVQGHPGEPIVPHLHGRRSHDQLHLELALGHGAVLLQVRRRRQRRRRPASSSPR